ncbi:hypothetical protein FQR65_LT01058 [Abscondita terminalis]|nr:hypothetical protein FQR65_LT01058 [Abscondita terminalis]
MGNTGSSWQQTYETIKKTHDDAYIAIEAAISLEEQEKPGEAIEKYKEGILLIDKALDTTVTCPEKPDSTWEMACNMIQKMKKTRAEVIMRINTIKSSPSFVPESTQTTSNENVVSSNDTPRTYSDLAAALNDIPVEEATSPAQLIYTHDNVQLYFISPDGSVSKTVEQKELNIFMIPGNEVQQRRVFLQIGDWIYPLIPGVSPCYRTAYGAFILPDLESEEPGASVGIILPSDADGSVYELLEDILHGIIGEETALPRIRGRTRRAAPVRPRTFSEVISNGLSTGGYYISQGLIMGAQKAGSLLNYGTPKIMNFISPAPEGGETISPTVVKGFEMASTATSTAAMVTGIVAGKVGSATQALGRFLAPHIQKQGTKLLTSGFNIPEDEASSKMNNIFTVAAGAVEGFSNIYLGLETSASILGNSLSNNTVSIVQHKYGDTAAHIASNTFNTVGNVITIGHNTKYFTPKGIAKTTAKQAGKAVVEDFKSHNLLAPSATQP